VLVPACCDALIARVSAAYRLQTSTRPEPLSGGDWNDVYRLETDIGPLVLRVSHPEAVLESVLWEHRLLRFVSPCVTEAPAPLVARDGTTCFLHEGRIVSLFPFMLGEMLMKEREVHRLEAARLLARLHRVLLEIPAPAPRPGYAALREWNWDTPRRWDWRRVVALLEGSPDAAPLVRLGDPDERESAFRREIVARRYQIADARIASRDFITRLAASGRPLHFGPVHGDYYRRNLLCVGDGISAVLDWDDSGMEWLTFELAFATFETCEDRATETLPLDRAHAFLAAYEEADGPVPRTDLDLLVSFMRAIRIIEVLLNLNLAAKGQPWDAEYTVHNLVALENLRGLRIGG
jgi:Ser/Thr protein kinase RdoA (MazF antagonist)